jgi:hypothetical protein
MAKYELFLQGSADIAINSDSYIRFATLFHITFPSKLCFLPFQIVKYVTHDLRMFEISVRAFMDRSLRPFCFIFREVVTNNFYDFLTKQCHAG